MDRRKLTALLMVNAKKKGLFFDLLALLKISSAVLVAVIFSVIGEGDAYFFTSYFLGGTAVLLLAFSFCRLNGLDFKSETLLKTTDKKNYILALLLLFAMLFGLSGLNGYFIEFLQKFGYKPTEIVLPNFSVANYFLTVICICVLPALTEEIAFRGIILNGVKPSGKIASAVIVGLLFALYHASPAQTVYQFAVGFLFALLAIKSGSVLPTVIVHFLNNFIIINLNYSTGGSLDFGNALNAVFTALGVLATGAFLYFTLKNGEEKTETSFSSSWLIISNFLKYAVLGIIAYGVLWIFSLK